MSIKSSAAANSYYYCHQNHCQTLVKGLTNQKNFVFPKHEYDKDYCQIAIGLITEKLLPTALACF